MTGAPRTPGSPGSHDDHPADLLSGLLDGELDIATTDAVQAHVDGCAACRAELDEVAEVRRALRAAPSMPAPPGYIDRVVARRRRASRQGAAVAALAAAVAVVLGLVVARPDPSPEPVASSWSAASADAAGGQFRDDVRATLADPGGQQGSGGSGATGTTGGQRTDADRPGPDDRDDRVADPSRHGVPSAGDEDSVLDRAHEIGGELLDLLGG
jgi:anti-sigma factor RsiW